MSDATSTAAAATKGPLTGVTVIELSRLAAGPMCTRVLADLGARVIKVEQAGGRECPAPETTGSAHLDGGKESIALDLGKDADRLIFDKLLERADVLVDSLGVRVLDGHGYAWEQLHARFPRLVHAAASGFGHTGPYAARPLSDLSLQAIGGLMSLVGSGAGEPPRPVVAPVSELAAALFTAVGVNAALYHRTMTGEAIRLDVAMLDSQLALLAGAIARHAQKGGEGEAVGVSRPPVAPAGAFKAKDGWLVLAATTDAEFTRLADALGSPWLATDPRFAATADRCQAWQALASEIEKALAGERVADWIEALDAADVLCAPVNRIDKVVADPQLRSRNMVVSEPDGEGASPLRVGNPIKMSSFPDPSMRQPAPSLDQDRARLVAEMMAPAAGHAPVPRGTSTALSTLGGRNRTGRLLLGYLRQVIGIEVPARTDVLGSGTFRDRAKVLAEALLSERGEVLGTVLAAELVHLVTAASGAERFELFELLASSFAQDPRRVQVAVDRWRADQSPDTYARLMAAVEPPRQELFRRMNMAPGGTAALIKLREELIRQLRDHPRLGPVDHDLRHLLGSWFNRGFLRLERISWHTPAVVLEKLIAYEAVHEIVGWDDLQRRLAADRRCYGFFHPALPDEPLIFVEVALVDQLADRIEPIIRAPEPAEDDEAEPTTAIFYSISNCQPGLRGISFGNFLIKQVAAELKRELPGIETFATLSPIPGFRGWLENPATDVAKGLPRSLCERIVKENGNGDLRDAVMHLARSGEAEGYSRSELLRQALLRLGARYLAGTGNPGGPTDAVARFHLGNGARIEQLNWMGDLSPKGIRQSHGLMVNYLYDLDEVEKNHEAFANNRPVAISKGIAALIDTTEGELLPQSLKSRVDAAMELLVRKA